MGEVYRARDPRLRREVAIKLLPARFARDPKRLARFENEILAAAALQHPNIITVHEVGQTEEGYPFIVMELIRGRTLRQILTGRPLLTPRALELAVQATEGLARAHAAGIVHRDIKPENIMVSDDGFVKILDFGLAKLGEAPSELDDTADVDPEAGRLRREGWASDHESTAVGAILGTACYMSPEQARGLPVDFRSDQFSCGATLYEMATGFRAFSRPTTNQTLAAIIESEPEPIAALNPDAPAPFRWVVERCLAKDPGERYASTLDLARDLRTVRDKLSEVTTAVVYPPRPRFTPMRAAIAAAGLGALLMAGAATLPQVREPLLRLVGRPVVPGVRHIAVLPFQGAGDTDAAFVEGLMDNLTDRLSQLERYQGSLWVVPASEVRQAGVLSASEALRAFGVNLAVRGRAQRTDDGRLRLHVELVDGKTERLLRSTTLEAPTSDGSVWQDAFVDRMIDLLEIDPGPEAQRAIRRGRTSVPAAYELYLQGRSNLARFEDLASLERATALFQLAVQQDPSYALAYAGAGEAHWRRYEITKTPEFAELAQRAAQKAVELNDLLAPVHVSLGLVRSGTGHDEQALKDFARALALDPSNGEALRGMAASQETLGRLAEAEATFKRAVGRKPDYWAGPNALAVFYYRHARYPEAEAAFREALRLAPDNVRVLGNLGGLYQTMGRLEEATSMLGRAARIRPEPDVLSNQASLQFQLGQHADAARTFERAVALRDEDPNLWRNLGSAYVRVADGEEKARAAFEKALELAERQKATNPRDPELLMLLADCNAMLARAEPARAYLKESLKQAPGNVDLKIEAAAISEHLGDRDVALRLVDQALAGGFAKARVEGRQDLAELRKDPRYGRAETKSK
jgi:serine/threonine-protein kinase